MDTKIIDQHLKWVRSLESEYRYVEQAPEEFDGFFEVVGTTTGAGLGLTVGSALGGPAGGALASGVLAAILCKVGLTVDKKLGGL